MQKIAIIGAGPAGIFSTLFLKDFPGEVHLFEQNADIGEKLKRTGGGRMNVANTRYDTSCFFSSAPHLKDHFFKAKHTKHISDLLAELGIEYTWEGSRAILKSQNAKAEVARLKQMILAQKNTTLHSSSLVRNIFPEKNGFLLQIKEECLFFDVIIIASGGMFRIGSHSEQFTIYHLLKNLGHSIVSPSPSLSPLMVSPHPLKELSGVALPMQFFTQKIKPDQNDGLITHFGFSGPVVLDFTAYWNGTDPVFINFLPTISEFDFLESLRNPANAKKTIFSFLSGYLPKRLISTFLSTLSLSFEKRLAELGKKDSQRIVDILFRYPVQSPKTMPYQASWTTKGGVDLQEIHMHSLESKLHTNCFLAGEVIDINGLCGGYHISFSLQGAKVISEEILKRT